MPPSKDATLDEIERSRRDYESTMCFWVFCFGLFLLVIGIFFLPYGHSHGVLGEHHTHHDDDDDSYDHYHGTGSQDDDDDDSGAHYHYAQLAAPAATPKLPHTDVMKTDYLGKHPSYRACESDADRQELRTATEELVLSEAAVHGAERGKWWPASIEPPTARVEFNEMSGTIEFSVEAPYLSRDAAYVVSFEAFEGGDAWKSKSDLLHQPTQCQSSPPFAQGKEPKETYAALWAHAPNAMYDPALMPRDVTTRGAYRVANGWSVNATKCSRVKYALSTTPQQLSACVGKDKSSLVTFASNGALASVGGTLWLNLVWPEGDDVGFVRWPFTFTLYVDTFESKVSIVDVNSDTHTSRTAYNPTSDALAVKSRIETAQRLAAKAAASGSKKAVNEVDLQVGVLCWRTFTSLVGTWFNAADDEKFFGINRTLDTTLHQRRALRLRLRTTNAADAAALLASQQTPLEQLAEKAAHMTPIYDVVGLVPSFSGELDEDNYGHFSVVKADFERDADKPVVQCALHGTEMECHRDWTLVLIPKTPELYQDSFEVRMCDASPTADADVKCSVAEPQHRVRIDVAVTDPSLDVADVKEMQIELSSHLNSAASKKLKEFRGGDRVCMQAYAVGPSALMQSIDLRLVGASICAPNARTGNERAPLPQRKDRTGEAASIQEYLLQEAAANTGCDSLSHSIHLYGADLTKKERRIVDQRYAPTLHEPGSYGSWSTALCFNASSIFVDATNSNVQRVTQFFEAEIVAVPTEKRRHNKHAFSAAEHRTFSAYAAAALSQPKASETAQHRAQSLQAALDERFDMLTSPQLGQMLRSLDAKNKITRFVSGKYDVQPASERERRLHNVNENTSLWLLLLIGLIGGLVACAFVLCCLTNRRIALLGEEPEMEPLTKCGDDNNDEESSF